MLDVKDGAARSRLSPALRRNFQRLLAPRSMAFIGGTQVERTLTTLRTKPFAGEVHVVHPARREIAGYACVPSLDDLPSAPDAVFLAVNADATIQALARLRDVDAGGVVCYASGFAEIGEAGAARHRAFVAASGEMAVVGPNCYGLVNYVNHGSIWPSPYPELDGRRGAAVISQSGNVTGHLVSNGRNVPYAYLISAGNQAVLGFEDYIEFLVDDPQVACIGLFMEGIRDVPAFAAACARAREAGMPVIVCRSGRSELGAALAVSHTSSLAGQNESYDALFRRLGVISTDTVPQFLEMMKIAALAPPLQGKRLSVYSSSGGDNGLAADYCSAAGLDLPQPTPQQVAVVKPMLPVFGHVSNPFDFTAGYWGEEGLLTPMLTTLLGGECDAGMLVVDFAASETPGQETPAHDAMDRALAAAGRATGKPVFHASVKTEGIPALAARRMIAQGIVPLQGLHDAAVVIARWAEHCERRRRDAASDGANLSGLAPYAAGPTPARLRTVDEAGSKRRLAAFGLTIPDGRLLSIDEIAALPESFAAPMAMKVVHEEIRHKTEFGGVALGLRGRADALAAAERMRASVARHAPGLQVERFLLEPMLAPPLAELIVGVKRDPLFGLVLLVGAGGILVELLKDAAALLLPFTRAEAEAALRSLKCFPLLSGFRGRPPADLEAVVDAIMAIAAYAAAHRDSLVELDVNPLMVGESSAVAVDALIVEAE